MQCLPECCGRKFENAKFVWSVLPNVATNVSSKNAEPPNATTTRITFEDGRKKMLQSFLEMCDTSHVEEDLRNQLDFLNVAATFPEDALYYELEERYEFESRFDEGRRKADAQIDVIVMYRPLMSEVTGGLAKDVERCW